MKHLHKTTALIFLLSGYTGLSAQAQHKRLIGLSKADHQLVIVDPASLKVLGKVPVGPDPHEVTVSPDGKTAYVSNTGSGFFHRIDVIDLVKQQRVDTIDTRPLIGPHGITFVNGKLWFAAQGAKAIGEYNPQSQKLELGIGTGQERTHMLYVTHNDKRIISTNVGSGTVSIFNYKELPPTVTPMGYSLPTAKPYYDWVQTIVPFKVGNEGYAVSPDEKECWTATPVDGAIGIISLQDCKLIQTIEAGILGANRLAYTPDGKMVLISSLRTGDLYFYDAQARKEISHIHIGQGCAHILIDPQGTHAYVSCTPDNYIAIIDLKMLRMTGKIDIGGRPDGLSWD